MSHTFDNNVFFGYPPNMMVQFLDVSTGCGAGMLKETWTYKPSIFTHGCLTIVQVQYIFSNLNFKHKDSCMQKGSVREVEKRELL